MKMDHLLDDKIIISLFGFNTSDHCANSTAVTPENFPEYDGYDKKTANALLVLAGINFFVIG